MGLFGKKLNYTAQCIGVINGVSAIEVNKMHLPLAEYFVDGKMYRVRVPHDIAAAMESESSGGVKIVGIDNNFGKGQMTRIQGRKVRIVYDPSKPKKGKVVGCVY